MSERPPIITLIREWYRKWCHEKYDNVPKEAIPFALRELFEKIKAYGYGYDDIGEANFRKIEEHCTVKKKEYKFPTDSWESKAKAQVRNISRVVFEPEYFGNVSLEEDRESTIIKDTLDQSGAKIDKYKPLDRSILKTDIIIEDKYDEDFIKLLEVPEEFRE